MLQPSCHSCHKLVSVSAITPSSAFSDSLSLPKLKKQQEMEIAEHRYMTLWKRFRTHLIKSDYSCSLSDFCRLTGTSYSGMGHWLMRNELSVSALKDEIRSECMGQNPNLPPMAPLVCREIPKEEFSVKGISVTFHSGTVLTIREGTPEGIIRLIQEYERKEGATCSL